MQKLTGEEMETIAIEFFLGKPPSIKGLEADKLRESFERQKEYAERNGLVPDIESEIPE